MLFVLRCLPQREKICKYRRRRTRWQISTKCPKTQPTLRLSSQASQKTTSNSNKQRCLRVEHTVTPQPVIQGTAREHVGLTSYDDTGLALCTGCTASTPPDSCHQNEKSKVSLSRQFGAPHLLCRLDVPHVGRVSHSTQDAMCAPRVTD